MAHVNTVAEVMLVGMELVPEGRCQNPGRMIPIMVEWLSLIHI